MRPYRLNSSLCRDLRELDLGRSRRVSDIAEDGSNSLFSEQAEDEKIRPSVANNSVTPPANRDGVPALSDSSGLSHTCLAGGGNASIRPFQCAPHWRAAGVPTGTYDTSSPHYQGYSSLDSHVRAVVADAIGQIDRLLATGRFNSLAFSWNEVTKLGGAIFETAQEVRDYIVAQLDQVAGKNDVRVIRSVYVARGQEGDFNFMIRHCPDVLFVFNDNEEEFRAHFNDPANPYGSAG